ncbi:nucleotidyltransferase domain-containing protein [Candidatus Bathyarchaeota archaeon]|nr:nucleotidyltransferase domain-containing protein [Candidatus Bathyarchaeota archaeon]
MEEPFNCIKRVIEGDDALTAELYSLILFGSYVRGDFKPGISDLDLLAVLRTGDGDIMKRLLEEVKRCVEGMDILLVDMPWVTVEELGDPIGKGYGLKFLTFYQPDFLANHRVIYGEEIAQLIPRYDPRDLAAWRAEKILANVGRFRDRPQLLRVSAGEAAKFLAVVHGVADIGKETVLSALRELGDEEAYSIYSDYVNGVDADRDPEYYAAFITSRMSAYLEAGGKTTGP